MSKCRLGHLLLMENVARVMDWPQLGAVCVLCDTGQAENVEHFLQRCPALAPCRTRLFHEAKRQLQSAGIPGRQILEQLRSGGAEQLRTMLSACERGAVISGEKELQALALWTMDKVAKAYLRACWRLRGALLGDLRVEHGVLKRDPSPLTPQDVLCEQRVVSTGVREQAPAVAMHADPNVSQSLSQPWCDWVIIEKTCEMDACGKFLGDCKASGWTGDWHNISPLEGQTKACRMQPCH